MIPTETRRKRLVFARNRSCFLVGASWSHWHEWEQRTTHLYLGLWTLTMVRNGRGSDG